MSAPDPSTSPANVVGLNRPLILASSSPRRRQLLKEAGYEFLVLPPDHDVECGVCSGSGPVGLVTELAYRKAAAVRNQILERPPAEIGKPWPLIILSADTVAECDGFILGKPRNEADARAMLNRLSGRDHRVLTGVCLWPANSELDLKAAGRDKTQQNDESIWPMIRVGVTRLRMDRLSEEQLADYLGSGEWEGKSGGFGYQDRLGWVHVVDGSESNVVGLPLELLAEMLREVPPVARRGR